MAGKSYYSLNELLDRIDEPNRKACYQLWNENKALFSQARGSKAKHQAWEGGYIDHIVETMNIAAVLYEPIQSRRCLPFTLSDALLVLFLHDLEKPWKHQLKEGKMIDSLELNTKHKRISFLERKLIDYNFELTPEHRNALQYVEGEGSDYDPHTRVQGPLAAFVHLCDVTSARIWFNHPLEKDDPWKGAGRKFIK